MRRRGNDAAPRWRWRGDEAEGEGSDDEEDEVEADADGGDLASAFRDRREFVAWALENPDDFAAFERRRPVAKGIRRAVDRGGASGLGGGMRPYRVAGRVNARLE